MPSLIILRGLPGAGKTTLAAELSEQGKWPVYSVDNFFTHPETGKYEFEFSKNHLAYQACEENTEMAMQKQNLKIFVDNAFTMEWELEPYFKLALKYNYRVFVMTVENRHKGKNIHGVTHEQLVKMAEKYKVILM